MSKLLVPEKRSATMYGYVKPSNKAWVEAQAKKRNLGISQMLDVFLDRCRGLYPVEPRKKKAA